MDLFDYARKNGPLAEAESVPHETKAPTQGAAPVISEKRDTPFIDSDGGLVIPFESDRKYLWWAGGQSIEDTLKEILGHDDGRAGVDISKQGLGGIPLQK